MSELERGRIEFSDPTQAAFAGLPDHAQPSNLPRRRKCPTCKGTGINPVWRTRVCPKCNGERVVGP